MPKFKKTGRSIHNYLATMAKHWTSRCISHLTWFPNIILTNLSHSPYRLSCTVYYTLESVPIHHRAQACTHICTLTKLEMSISLICLSSDCRRKPAYYTKGGHKNSVHTDLRRESNPETWRCEATVLITNPPIAVFAKSLLLNILIYFFLSLYYSVWMV